MSTVSATPTLDLLDADHHATPQLPAWGAR
jgi:hypothetical protein